jgi:PAS domain S-box-containing protein
MGITDRADRSWLAAIVESSDDAIVSRDLDGVVTSWNAAAERLFGHSAEEMVGRRGPVLAAPGREAETRAILGRVRAGGRVEHFETRRVRKDGAIVDVSITVSPIRDAEGRIVGVSEAARDIGERLRARRERGLLAAIVDSSDDAIASKDLDGVVTSWNAAAERLFGHSAGDMVGRHISAIAAPGHEAEMPMILARIRRGETVDHFETRRRHKDGRILDISLTVSPIRDDAGRIVGASKIARDIGERKSTERRLRLMADELDHRAKNVLAVAQAMLRLTRADDVRQYVAAVEGRIAALARAHAQVAESHWHGADLALLVRSGLEPFRADLGRLAISGPEALLGPVAAQALSIVLHELATNAAKHGSLSVPDGSVEVSWTLAGDGDLTLRWVESGGPPVVEPARRGFGSRVVERQVPDQLGGAARIEWAAAGLRCEFRVPAAHLAPAPARGRAAPTGEAP